MALTDEGTSTTMLVQPSYGGMNNGGFGFGGDWAWIILLLLAFGGGWGMGGFGGFGGMDGLYPWLNNSQNINGGFRDQYLNSQIGDLRTDVNRGFGDIQLGIAGVNQNICQTGNGIVNALNSGFNGAEIAANNRQMANMQQVFGLQSQLAQCCCDNRAATQDVKYTIATEACATRSANAQNTQAILDKLCQLELDSYKQQVEAKNDQIGQLRSQLQFANMQASQVDQTAQLRANQATVANQLVSELRSCPIPAQPVYGNQPIFTCSGPQWNNSGCGCGVA